MLKVEKCGYNNVLQSSTTTSVYWGFQYIVEPGQIDFGYDEIHTWSFDMVFTWSGMSPD